MAPPAIVPRSQVDDSLIEWALLSIGLRSRVVCWMQQNPTAFLPIHRAISSPDQNCFSDVFSLHGIEFRSKREHLNVQRHDTRYHRKFVSC